MALLDLFRPKWLNSDRAVRLSAVTDMNDPAILARIAREDADPTIRAAAIARIDDSEILARIALTGPISPMHEAALEQLRDDAVIARIAHAAMDPKVREAAVLHLKDQNELTNIATSASQPELRLAATARLSDQQVLATIAQTDSEAAVRAGAAAALTDRAILARIASTDDDPEVRLAAARSIQDEAVLVRMVTEDPDLKTREAVVALIDDQEALCRIVLTKIEFGSDMFGDQFALRAGHDAALAKLTDETLLARVAKEAGDQTLARAAVTRLLDPSLIRSVIESTNWFAREAAIARLDDAATILDLISSESDLDVLAAAVTRLAEPQFEPLPDSVEIKAAIAAARDVLRVAADTETAEAGSERRITGSLPSAAKVAAQFERIVGTPRASGAFPRDRKQTGSA